MARPLRVVYFNKRHRRKGHLFQGRFKAILLDAPEDLFWVEPVL